MLVLATIQNFSKSRFSNNGVTRENEADLNNRI